MKSTENLGSYQKYPFPKHRALLGDIASLCPKYPIQALVEVDVARARTYLRHHKDRTRQTLSFMGWLIRCIAQAVSEYKQVQAYRKGKELIVFDDVDVSFTMERQGQQEGGGAMVAGATVWNRVIVWAATALAVGQLAFPYARIPLGI